MFTFLLHTISRGCKTGSWTGDLKVQLPSSLAVASVYFFFVPWFHCRDINVSQFTNITLKTGQVNNLTRTKSSPIKRYCIAEVYSNYATAIQNTPQLPFITKLTPNLLTTCSNTNHNTSVDRWWSMIYGCCIPQRLDPPFGSQITFGFCTWCSYLETVLTQFCRVWRFCSISLGHTNRIYDLWLQAKGRSGIFKCRSYRNFSRESLRITKSVLQQIIV